MPGSILFHIKEQALTRTYETSGWDLSELGPALDSPAMDETLATLQTHVADFEKLRTELNPGMAPDHFNDLLDQLENLTKAATKLQGLAVLRVSEDTQNQKFLSFLAKVEDFMAGLQNRTLFFELWFKDLTDEQAALFLPGAGDRRYWLESLRRFKPHTMSEPEEKVINIKEVTGRQALTTLYDTITNRYVYRLELDGQVKEMTRGALMTYARHHDADLRARAYQELYRVFGADGPILGQIYQALVRDWKNEQIDLRRHFRPVSARNLGNDLPDDVVKAMLNVCRQKAGVFQDYFRLKAKCLGRDYLRRYDIYAPVVKSDRTYDFDQAVDLVLTAFGSFDAQVADYARAVLDQNHIDNQVRPGKREGAFCASILPGMTPWILMNYQGRSDDVATLAHELGHAVHAMLAGNHSIFTFEAPLPLAENASTFGEMLLLDHWLSQGTDVTVRRDLLFRLIDDAYATIMRQAFFAMFEEQAHDLVQQQATVDDLAGAYLGNLKEQFGEAVAVTEEFRWEWVSIPHFYHSPFYVYAYSFGHLLVLSLYRQYKSAPESFRPLYLNILQAGGSRPPLEILSRAGVNIGDPLFWEGGFAVIQEFIQRLVSETGRPWQ